MTVSQTIFRGALLDPEAPRPDGLADGSGAPAGKRFDVYRNNVVVSLKEALGASFPALAKLIGDANFDALSSLFVRAHPPEDPRMMQYGTVFPAFLEGFAPLAEFPYLADVARLELALRESYHAADGPAFDASALTNASPEQLASARLVLAPAVRLLRSDWPVCDIWHYAMSEDAPAPSGGAQSILVTRAEFDPAPQAITRAGATLIESLACGTALGPALEHAHLDDPDFDFPALLGVLLGQNAIADLHFQQDD